MKIVNKSAKLLVSVILLGLFFYGPDTFAASLQLNYNLAPLTATNHLYSVPEGASLLVVKVTEGRGNLDLFLKKGSPVSGKNLTEIKADADIYSAYEKWRFGMTGPA